MLPWQETSVGAENSLTAGTEGLQADSDRQRKLKVTLTAASKVTETEQNCMHNKGATLAILDKVS